MVAAEVEFLLTCRPFNVMPPDRLRIREIDLATGTPLASGSLRMAQDETFYEGKASSAGERMIRVRVRKVSNYVLTARCVELLLNSKLFF